MILKPTAKLSAFVIVLLFFATPALAQNTKGDKAEVSSPRQTRFKGRTQKRKISRQSFNRFTPNRYSLANSARSFARPRKASSPGKANIFSQHGRFVNNPSTRPGKGKRVVSRKSDRPRSASSVKDNIYSQHGPYVNNPSPHPRSVQRSVSNKKTLTRLAKIQSSPRNKKSGKKVVIEPRTASSSFIRHKTINTNARFWNVQRKGEKAVTTDISGKPLRTKNFRTPPQPVAQSTFKPYQYRKKTGERAYEGPSPKRYVVKPRATQNAWQGDITGRKIRGRNFSSKVDAGPGDSPVPLRKVRPSRERPFRGVQPGGYRSRSGPGEKRTGKSLPARAPGMGANGVNYSGRLKGGRPVKGGGSRGGFWNNKGYAIQPRTPGIGANGIAGFQGNVKAKRPVKGGGSRSGRLWNNRRSPIAPDLPPARAAKAAGFPGKIKRFELNPGLSDQGEAFSGFKKASKPLKHRGRSRSGKLWNNKGYAVQPRIPGKGASMEVGTFQGNIKGGKPVKGGGSVSGRVWNNKGYAIQPRLPKGADLSIGSFRGNIKGGKPVKGGGSVSGRVWNNKGYAIQPRLPKGADLSVGSFSGNIKAHKPVKGGGSVSGKVWNNKGYAIQPRLPKGADLSVGTFSGNIKAKKPVKGGGSVSGRVWNNKQTPIPAKTPPASQAKMGRYQGDKLIFDQSPIFENQGEEFTGYIKLPKFRRTYKQNPKAVEESILKRKPSKKAFEVEDLQVKVQRRKFVENKNLPEVATKKLKPTEATKSVAGLQIEVTRRKYVVNKNLPEEATKKLKPTDATNAIGNLQIKVERRKYVVNKNSAELALKKLKPTDATNAVGNLQVKVKQYHYIHNASSAKDALNVREPGKAFARVSDYQGNIKMKKFELAKLFSERNRKLHPDAKFMKINKNNVKEERSMITNIKLWWAKNFRKNKTQPEHLKENDRKHKPRYDKGEQGLWAE